MLNLLATLSRSRIYWFLVLLACLTMEGTALYYQYGLDYGPCVLCVQVRAWLLGLALVALVMLFLPAFAFLGQFLSLLLASGLLYTSWRTLGIERGTIIDSCTMDAGFPDWLPLQRWLPQVFEPWEPCGYTPELPFGITMAEGLVVIGLAWVAVSLVLTLASLAMKRSAAGW